MHQEHTSELYIYLEWDLRVTEWSQIWRPMEALTYVSPRSMVSLSLPTRSFIFTCIVKIAQGDWNRCNLEPPCPPYLASLFAQSVTGSSHSIYIYIYIYIWSSLEHTRHITSANLFFFFHAPKSFNKPFEFLLYKTNRLHFSVCVL